MDLRLEMPAFHHPFAQNRHLQNNSRVMCCLQGNHGAKTVRDLVQVSMGEGPGPLAACPLRNPGRDRCKEKAKELLNRMGNRWNPGQETPQRHNLWHTPRRIERNKGTDPVASLVLYNPDTRSTHNLLGGIRIFGNIPGHKSRERDPFLRERAPMKGLSEAEGGL